MLIVERSEKHEPELVTIPERLRHMNESRVQDLMASFTLMGQMTPIQVRIIGDGDDVVLVAGRHRLEAARRLGWEKILINVVEGSEDDFRLWEIAENLHRAELTVLERSEHIAEWVRLTEVKVENQVAQVALPEAVEPDKPGQVAQVSNDGNQGGHGEVGQLAPLSKGGRGKQSGIAAAARGIGVERTEARRAIKIDSITPEAKQAARDAGVDRSQSALLKVAAAPAEQQKELVDRIRDIKAEAALQKAKPLSDRQIVKRALAEEITDAIATLEDVLGDRFTEIAEMLCRIDLSLLYARLAERLGPAGDDE